MRLLQIVILLSLAAGPLSAATTNLTFGDIVGHRSWNGAGGFQSALEVSESGYRYDTASSYFGGATITLHDDAGGLQSATIRREDGRRFSLKQFDLAGVSRLFRTSDAPYPASPTAKERDDWAMATEPALLGWRVEGYLGGASSGTLTSSIVGRASAPEISTIVVGAALGKVDSLTISLLLPAGARYGATDDWFGFQDYGSGSVWCDGYCGSARFSNVVLSTPLPPGGLALLSAICLAAALRRRVNP